LGSLLKGDDGNFYGMTNKGGTFGYGTIFRMSATGAITILRQLNYNTDGGYPDGELIKGVDDYLYGVTTSGGATSYGTIFKISTSGDFSVIKSFNYAADGAHPYGHLTLAKDGNYYGTTYNGGANSVGTIYKLTPGGTFSVIHHMSLAADGGNSYSSLVEGSDGNLYGVAYYGGTYGYGTIFRVTTGGNLTLLKSLNASSDGGYPLSDLIQGKDGNFYGTASSYGPNGGGTIFKITAGSVFIVVKSLSYSADGSSPAGALTQNTDGTFYGMNRNGGTNSGGTIYKIANGVYSVIHAMQPKTEGGSSSGALVKGNDGNLYALAGSGGTYNIGTAFKVSTGGNFTLLATFDGAIMGNAPYNSLTKGKDSAYYATTTDGGAYNYGTIVKICGGSTTVLLSFNGNTTGGTPKGGLIQASDGNFYGTASVGGTNNAGVIFKITPGGNYSIVHNFNNSADGGTPQGNLIQASDGFLYGMNSGGGKNNVGTIFRVALGGAYTVVRHLTYATDGGNPVGSLVQANDGNLYGIMANGGKIFQLTLSGTFNVIHTLSGSEGSNATGSLIQGIDGNLYGTCSDGGINYSGTIFQVSLGGAYKVIKMLNATTDGRMPKGNLLQGPDGMLYGLTSIGGTYNTGTIFKITTGGNLTVLRHLNVVADGGNPYGSLIFAPVNNLVANPQSVTTDQDKAVNITLTGSGGSTLNYTIASQPKNGTLSGTGANRTYTPNPGYYGKDSFFFKAAIGCMASAPAKVSITVKQVASVNHAPVLDSIKNKSVIVNDTLKFKATAKDADTTQILTFSLTSAPAGAKINAKTGQFTWTPTITGTYTATIRVTDNGTPALYDEQAFTIKVKTATTGLNSDMPLSANTMKSDDTKLFSASLYPNPVHNTCNLQFNTAIETINIVIAGAKGSTVMNKQLQLHDASAASLDVTTLTPGMYFLTVQTPDKRQIIKFIKQ